MEVWIFRACIVQGLQQAYVIALWYWGSSMSTASSEGVSTTTTGVAGSWKMTYVSSPVFDYPHFMWHLLTSFPIVPFATPLL